MAALGKLEGVPLRNVWPHEAKDFTPWLATSENLAALAEALNLGDVQIQGTEVQVGNFSIDILAQDVEGGLIVIENQFGQTDHRHLGQIMTYIAGQEGSVTVVWIAEIFREEHRAAIDWLNASTIGSFNFFAVEMELLRIAESLPAPRFNVVSKPNEWSRGVARKTRQTGDASLNERQEFYLDYWTQLAAFLAENGFPLKVRRTFKDYWYAFRLGRTGVQIGVTAALRDKTLGVELYISRNDEKATFRALENQKSDIERIVGEALDWQEMPGKKASRIAIYRAADPADETNRADQLEWLRAKLERFYAAFYDRVRDLSIETDNDAADAEREDLSA